VIALASALGLALLAIAFLLGRISNAPTVVTLAAPVPVPNRPQPSDISPASDQAAPTPLSQNTVAASLESSGPAAAYSATPSALTQTPTMGTSPSPERQQIAAYFSQVDRLEDMGGGDPQAFATTMVQSMSSGDFSGFEDLLSKARSQRQRLQSIAPPRACAEHHRLALTLAGDSVTMLERVKAAMVKGDAAALLAIASDGRTLETQANQLKAIAEAIKRQAGL